MHFNKKRCFSVDRSYYGSLSIIGNVVPSLFVHLVAIRCRKNVVFIMNSGHISSRWLHFSVCSISIQKVYTVVMSLLMMWPIWAIVYMRIKSSEINDSNLILFF